MLTHIDDFNFSLYISSMQLWFLYCYQCVPWVQLYMWWQWSFPV